MFEGLLENLLRRVTESYGQETGPARSEWFSRTGEPFVDEAGYEQRLQNFVEWYVFDYQLPGGLTPFEAFLADGTQPAEEREEILPFREQVHSLFQLGRRVFGGMFARDLRTGRKYPLPADSVMGYRSGDVVEMRLVPWEDGFRPTQTYLYYPAPMAKQVRRAARVLRRKGSPESWEAFLCRSSYLHLKAARFRHVTARDIFKDAVKPEWLGEKGA